MFWEEVDEVATTLVLGPMARHHSTACPPPARPRCRRHAAALLLRGRLHTLPQGPAAADARGGGRVGGVGSLGGAQSGAWRMCALGINVLRISTAQLEALAGVAVDALQAALNSFLAASPHQVVQDIQRGKLPGPGEVRAVGGRWGWGRDAAGTLLSAVRVLRSHPAFPLPCDAEQVPWEAREIQLFGKPVMQPRLIAYMADGPEMQYSYSGATVTPTPW